MAIGMYPIPPPDAKTLAAIFGTSRSEDGDNSSHNYAPPQSPNHSELSTLDTLTLTSLHRF